MHKAVSFPNNMLCLCKEIASKGESIWQKTRIRKKPPLKTATKNKTSSKIMLAGNNRVELKRRPREVFPPAVFAY